MIRAGDEDDDDFDGFDGPSEDDEPEEPETPEEDDGDEPEPVEPTRAEKKQARDRKRFDERVARAAEAEVSRRMQEFEARNQAHIQTLIQAVRPAPAQQPPQRDQWDDKLELVRQRKRSISDEYDRLPPEQQTAKLAEYQRKFQEASDEELEIIADRRDARRAARYRPDPAQTQRQAFYSHMAGKYADVYGNERAIGLADAKWREAVARGTVNEGNFSEVFERCLVDARKEILGRGTGERPSQKTKARFQGTPAASRGPTEKGAPQTITKQERKMAMARYPELDEAAAVSKWFKNIKNKKKNRGAAA